jgi:hypothetical protein
MKEKGSITVETAVVFPFFIMIVLTIAFFIKIVYAHQVINYALYQAADEMASYSYIYSVSGFEKLNDSLNNNLLGIQCLPEEKLNQLIQIKNRAALMPILSFFIERQLKNNEFKNADQRVEFLNIVGGIKGLDFSSSHLLDNNKDIDIIVKYKVNLPIPIRVLPSFQMVEHVKMRAWLDGDSDIPENTQSNIWQMDPQERGRLIDSEYRRIFGDISSEIISINLNDATYQKNPSAIKSKIKMAISKSNINNLDQLIVVIPKKSMSNAAKSSIYKGFEAGRQEKKLSIRLKIIEIEKLDDLKGGTYE